MLLKWKYYILILRLLFKIPSLLLLIHWPETAFKTCIVNHCFKPYPMFPSNSLNPNFIMKVFNNLLILKPIAT